MMAIKISLPGGYVWYELTGRNLWIGQRRSIFGGFTENSRLLRLLGTLQHCSA